MTSAHQGGDIHFDILKHVPYLSISFVLFPLLLFLRIISKAIQKTQIIHQHMRQSFKIRRRLDLEPLKVAICNVILFKSLKDKDFKDSIFVSYQKRGPFLQATSEEVWQQAYLQITNFLESKSVRVFVYGYPREIYQQVIDIDLKQIIKSLRQQFAQPYINIIHYQRLRKSCQFMEKEGYLEPVFEWEKIQKNTPNFAILVVQPIAVQERVIQQLISCIERRNKKPVPQMTLKEKPQQIQLKHKHILYLKFSHFYSKLTSLNELDLQINSLGPKLTKFQQTEQSKQIWEHVKGMLESKFKIKALQKFQCRSRFLRVLGLMANLRQSMTQGRILSSADIRSLVSNERSQLVDCLKMVEGRLIQKFGQYFIVIICKKQQLIPLKQQFQTCLSQLQKKQFKAYQVLTVPEAVLSPVDFKKEFQLVTYKAVQVLLKIHVLHDDATQRAFADYINFLGKTNLPCFPRFFGTVGLNNMQSRGLTVGLLFQNVTGCLLKRTIIDLLQAAKYIIQILSSLHHLSQKVQRLSLKFPRICFRNDLILLTPDGISLFIDFGEGLQTTQFSVLAGRVLYSLFEDEQLQQGIECSPIVFERLSGQCDRERRLKSWISKLLLREVKGLQQAIQQFKKQFL